MEALIAIQLPDSCGLTKEIVDCHLRATDLRPDLKSLPVHAMKALRRLLWAKLLRVVSSNSLQGWASELDVHRKRYEQLKEAYQKDTEEMNLSDPSKCNPLSKSWAKMQADNELWEEIWKDIERTYSEIFHLQREKTRKCMQQVLFHWCKANAPDGYRQGMNELVALCMYAVLQGQSLSESIDDICYQLCGHAHNEADVFTLFSALMGSGVSDMFEVVKVKPKLDCRVPVIGSPTGSTQQTRSAVLARCDHIFNTLLKTLDLRFHALLSDVGIEPQIFMLRWLRLLFCREFSIDDGLALWTAIFAHAADPDAENMKVRYDRRAGEGIEVAVAEAASEALPLVDFFAVAMLVSMKAELAVMDESGAMCALMKFKTDLDIQILVDLAKVSEEQWASRLSRKAAATVGNSSSSEKSLLVSDDQQGSNSTEVEILPLSSSSASSAQPPDLQGNLARIEGEHVEQLLVLQENLVRVETENLTLSAKVAAAEETAASQRRELEQVRKAADQRVAAAEAAKVAVEESLKSAEMEIAALKKTVKNLAMAPSTRW